MGARILQVEWETICLGRWVLGQAAAASRDLDSRAMGSPRRGLRLGCRILALEHPPEKETADLPTPLPGFPEFALYQGTT